MIAYIEGKLAVKEPAYVIVEAYGIGYEIRISLNTYQAIKDLDNCKLMTHLHIKEDAHTLFGFHNRTEKKLFLDLISISGVGPGTGIVVLSSLPAGELKAAIINGEANLIQSIKGIGAKTAQRIILELRDKLQKEDSGTSPSNILESRRNTASQEALSALVTLGFNKNQAEKSIHSIAKKHGDQITVEEIIKLALKSS